MSGVRRFGLDHISTTAERLLARGVAMRPSRGEMRNRSVGPNQDNHLVRVRLLTLNDFHGALAPVGQVEGRPAGGAAYLAAHLARERSEDPENSLLVHSGDMIGLTPPASGLLQDEPTAAILNRLGFAAGAVGNHEFDEGLDELVRLLDGGSHPATIWRTGSFPGLNFPCLAANVLSERTGHPILPAARVLSIAGVRIGLVGVVGTEAGRQLGAIASGLRFADEAATVNHHVNELREHHVAAIVVLAHLGGVGSDTGAGLGGKLPAFAAALDPEVDVIVAGHTHQPAVADIAGKLTVQAHPHGLSYGAVDLWIDRRLNRVVDRAAALNPTWHEGIEPDPAVTALVTSYERLASPLAESVVTVHDAPIVREPAASGETALGPLIADAYRAATGAEIALVHPTELRADLPAGPVTRRDLYCALPGGHDLLTVKLSGATIARLFDDRSRPAKAPRPYCSGANPEIAPDRAPGRRVASIWMADGTRMDPAATYAVALAAPTLGNLPAGDVQVTGKTLAAAERFLRGLPRRSAASSDNDERSPALAAS